MRKEVFPVLRFQMAVPGSFPCHIPAWNILLLKVGVESLGNSFILMSVADEEGGILDGTGSEQRGQVVDLSLCEANPTQEVRTGWFVIRKNR